MIFQQHLPASVIDSFPKMGQAMGPGQGSGGARQMLTAVFIGPERSSVLRENTTGPASPPQTLRVCYGPDPVLRTWDPITDLESSQSCDSPDAGRG